MRVKILGRHQLSQRKTHLGNMQRSSNQNRAIHLLFTQISEALDREGHTVQDVTKAIRKAEIRVTPEIVKEVMWKPLQQVMYGKKSTTELSKSEVDRVYEALNHFIGREFGLHVPFPSREKEDTLINNLDKAKEIDYPEEYKKPLI